MRSLALEISLALKDIFRLWSASQLQIIIIAGICLPILILLGLKNGHVEELRRELATSPTGRQVIFWSSQSGDLLAESNLNTLRQEIDNTELLIPESQRLIFITSVGTDNTSKPSETEALTEPIPLTLYSTLPGDPILKQFNVYSPEKDSSNIVISESLATRLGVEVNQQLTIELRRQIGSEREQHQILLTVSGIVPSGQEDDSAIGYAHLALMDELERYGSGGAVDRWEIPAAPSKTAVDLYSEMLLFCFKGQRGDLTENDHLFLKSRGLVATRMERSEVRLLYGLLRESSLEELEVYLLRRLDFEENKILPIQDTPQLLARNTEAEDDFVLRWHSPLTGIINNQKVSLIGLTLPQKKEVGGWIQNFVNEEAVWYSYEESVTNPFQISFRNLNEAIDGNDLLLSLSSDQKIKLTQKKSAQQLKAADQARPAADAPKSTGQSQAAEKLDIDENQVLPVAIVPVNLLAYLRQFDEALVEYDVLGNRFVEVMPKLFYTKARLYARTIDDVPKTVDALAKKNFAVLSESTRISEIQAQDNSLQFLVVVVAICVFIFGVLTVFSVMVDSTDRKKGTIGILRVMGMGQRGIFTLVTARALGIGFLSAFLCSVLGYGLAIFFGTEWAVTSDSYIPRISIVLNLSDIMTVSVGALLCAVFGTIVPALKASRLDPFDAIMEGRH